MTGHMQRLAPWRFRAAYTPGSSLADTSPVTNAGTPGDLGATRIVQKQMVLEVYMLHDAALRGADRKRSWLDGELRYISVSGDFYYEYKERAIGFLALYLPLQWWLLMSSFSACKELRLGHPFVLETEISVIRTRARRSPMTLTIIAHTRNLWGSAK